jgi:hypothetical protein
MPACLTRYASTMSAWLTSARTDSSMTVKAKLFINAEPGFIVRGRIREFIRTWPHLRFSLSAHRGHSTSETEVGCGGPWWMNGIGDPARPVCFVAAFVGAVGIDPRN